jgi:(R,R)-butanediol dehydrogenase/meso-butanediol dehydrogenase/diacetyl reductase
MKALVFHNVQDIRFEPNWPDPRPLRPGEVKVAASWCGICGTDMEDFHHGAVVPIGEPHPLSGRMAPLVLGHEYSGRIAEVGPGVENLEVGQRVACECVLTCQKCYWCKIGEYSICENMVSIGQQDDGGLADFFVVPAKNCVPIPDHLGEDIAAMTEPLAVMVRAIRRGGVKAGDLVTVVGAGTIGLCGIAVAKAAGARGVIAIAHGGKRAQVASEMGATHVLNSKDDDWRDRYAVLTDGLGSDVVIDAGGNIAAMRLAIELTKRQGRCVINSVVDADVPMPGLDILLGEKEIVGTVGHSTDREFRWALQFLADGRIDVEPIITDRIYIGDGVERGFKRLAVDRDQIKILVTPHKGWVK